MVAVSLLVLMILSLVDFQIVVVINNFLVVLTFVTLLFSLFQDEKRRGRRR